jgi:hypothetical protein
MDPALLLKNAVSTLGTSKTFGVPVVHSTVNARLGRLASQPGKTAYRNRWRLTAPGSCFG